MSWGENFQKVNKRRGEGGIYWKPESTVRKEIPFKNVSVKAMFPLTVFKILLFISRIILSPAQRGTGNERGNLYTVETAI